MKRVPYHQLRVHACGCCLRAQNFKTSVRYYYYSPRVSHKVGQSIARVRPGAIATVDFLNTFCHLCCPSRRHRELTSRRTPVVIHRVEVMLVVASNREPVTTPMLNKPGRSRNQTSNLFETIGRCSSFRQSKSAICDFDLTST